jgi:uncharacterized membrane protein YesL
LWESPFVLSTRHFTAGSVLLIILCLSYFLHLIAEDSEIHWLKEPSFLICTAICLYEAITFFIFLFIYPMFDANYNQNLDFALLMMRIYQGTFVLFCLLLALALFSSYKQEKYNGRLYKKI